MKAKNSGNRPYPGTPVPKPVLTKVNSDEHLEGGKDFSPEIDISETATEYEIRMVSPGLKRENLMVSVNENANLLVLLLEDSKDFKSGKKNKPSSPPVVSSKEIKLPSFLDTEFVAATCHAGILKIVFKKATSSGKCRPHTISVY